MKTNILEEIRSLADQSKRWLTLEVEYLKLTAAEKMTLLMGSLIIGFVALLLAMVVLIMLALSLAEVFKLMMNPALAYLSTAGAICILLGVFFLLRRPLLMNPIARLITKVFFDKKH
ncbi:MAG: phage holin family protein [Bacteroidales bacterium]|nr:phage holin family protein [Bacteroidales bacterium]MBD5205830.1 phage holin family protein [Bacteroidales bacterium]MBD5223809.1 phage holin family protein [Bacteroidales bacterium]MBD5302364.1 phage holin family protein [Bacteroides sp.]MBD5348545.1 phage holin family protein [Bacteroides sp.]